MLSIPHFYRISCPWLYRTFYRTFRFYRTLRRSHSRTQKPEKPLVMRFSEHWFFATYRAALVQIPSSAPKACDKKMPQAFFICCIVENWRLRQPIFELLFIKMSSGFQTVGHFYCLIFPQNSELRQGRGQFFWEKQNKSCCFQNVFNFPVANFWSDPKKLDNILK